MRKTAISLLLATALLTLGSCGAELAFRKAEQSYAIGEYAVAAPLFKKAYSGTPSQDKPLRAERAYMLGECYRHLNTFPKALAAYQNAVRYNCQDSTAIRYLADMQLATGNYKDAAKNYTAFLEKCPDDFLALNGLKSCSLTQEWKKSPTRFEVKKADVFNSRRSEWSPVLAGEEYNQLYFTTTREDVTGEDVNGITGLKSCDIFRSTQDEQGKWQKPEKIEGGPNSEYEDGSCCFNADFSTMYFTRCSSDPDLPRPAQIMQSSRADASWGEGKEYADKPDTLYSYAHPAASPDGEWIYFVSDMPGGYGGLDIWKVPTGGRFIGAENLGPTINTPGNECFPTFRKNGELYFSSDGWPGMGGLDIFKAEQLTDSTWQIRNMQAPINSFADDLGMTFEGEFTRGFFASNRQDGRGRDHIFSFSLPETIHTLTGWVYEKDGYELPDASVYIVGNDGRNEKLGLKQDGSFTVRVNPGTSYVLLGSHRGYLNYKQEITADTTDQDREYVLQFPLSSITKPVLIDNIFFEFAKADLTPESAQSLDQLTALLNDNPNVTIELSAHCDYKGNDDYNQRLSQARAESVVNYLIEHGIESERLTPKGYGESKPQTISAKQSEKYPFLKENQELTEQFILTLPEEQQEICNQLNRRTEFRVLRTTYHLYQ